MMIRSSNKANRTKNPIRNIVDNLQPPINHPKSFLNLALGDPTIYGNLKCPDVLRMAVEESLMNNDSDGYFPSVGCIIARNAIAEKTNIIVNNARLRNSIHDKKDSDMYNTLQNVNDVNMNITHVNDTSTGDELRSKSSVDNIKEYLSDIATQNDNTIIAGKMPKNKSYASNRSTSSNFTDSFSYENKNGDSDTSYDSIIRPYSLDEDVNCSTACIGDYELSNHVNIDHFDNYTDENNSMEEMSTRPRGRTSDHIFYHLNENNGINHVHQMSINESMSKHRESEELHQKSHETWNETGEISEKCKTYQPVDRKNETDNKDMRNTANSTHKADVNGISSNISNGISNGVNRNHRALNNSVCGEDVIITSGCSGAVEMAISVLLNEGDNLLVPRPGFPLYRVITESLGGNVKEYPLKCESDWECDTVAMEAMIDSHTRAILITNPSNPCGTNYSPQHLLSILAVARKFNLPIIADEIYGGCVFDQNSHFTPIASLCDDVPILSLGGLAKEYVVPGWRVGWVVIHDTHSLLPHTLTPLPHTTPIPTTAIPTTAEPGSDLRSKLVSGSGLRGTTGHKGIGNGGEYLNVSCLTMGDQRSGKELGLKDGNGMRECKGGEHVNESVRERQGWVDGFVTTGCSIRIMRDNDTDNNGNGNHTDSNGNHNHDHSNRYEDEYDDDDKYNLNNVNPVSHCTTINCHSSDVNVSVSILTTSDVIVRNDNIYEDKYNSKMLNDRINGNHNHAHPNAHQKEFRKSIDKIDDKINKKLICNDSKMNYVNNNRNGNVNVSDSKISLRDYHMNGSVDIDALLINYINHTDTDKNIKPDIHDVIGNHHLSHVLGNGHGNGNMNGKVEMSKELLNMHGLFNLKSENSSRAIESKDISADNRYEEDKANHRTKMGNNEDEKNCEAQLLIEQHLNDMNIEIVSYPGHSTDPAAVMVSLPLSSASVKPASEKTKGRLYCVRQGLRNLSQLTLGATSLIQTSLPRVLTPLKDSEDFISLEKFHTHYMETLRENTEICIKALTFIPELSTNRPKGAMYLMLKIKFEMFFDIFDDTEFARKLLLEENLSVLPGVCFSMSGYIRLVTCSPVIIFSDALDRLKLFCFRHNRDNQ